jgi:hypothetical protein
MKTSIVPLMAIVLGLMLECQSQQTSCDFELMGVSTVMGNFNTKGYNPLNVSGIYDRLNSLRATILATYLLCFNKSIIDPDSLYPQDITECFHGLYNVSQLAGVYTGNSAKIKSEIDIISKIVFSTQNNCRPVLYYKGWDNLTTDCKSMIPTLDELFNKYGEEMEMGKDGLSYINSMILLTERLRKLCGFNILTKANTWAKDTCDAANTKWLYPLTDQMDTFVIQNKFVNFTSTFYNLYQSLYRVKSVCNVGLSEER